MIKRKKANKKLEIKGKQGAASGESATQPVPDIKQNRGANSERSALEGELEPSEAPAIGAQKTAEQSAEPGLSNEEWAKYQANKLVIKKGLKAYLEVGAALVEIQTGRLYREEYGSFREFCEKEYGFTAKRGYELIRAFRAMAETFDQEELRASNETSLGEAGTEDSTPSGKAVPANLHQALAAAKVKKTFRAPALRRAKEKAEAEGRAMVANDIAQAAAELSEERAEDANGSVDPDRPANVVDAVSTIASLDQILKWIQETRETLESGNLDTAKETLTTVELTLVAYIKATNQEAKAA